VCLDKRLFGTKAGRLLRCVLHAARGDCDIEVVSSTTHRNGSITSPGFPSVYPSDTDCRFTLQPNTHAAERVQLVFTEFDLHYPIGDPREPY